MDAYNLDYRHPHGSGVADEQPTLGVPDRGRLGPCRLPNHGQGQPSIRGRKREEPGARGMTTGTTLGANEEKMRA